MSSLGNFFPFILKTSAHFPSKKSHSKVAHFQIYGHMSTGGKLVNKNQEKLPSQSQWKKRDASPTGLFSFLSCVLIN